MRIWGYILLGSFLVILAAGVMQKDLPPPVHSLVVFIFMAMSLLLASYIYFVLILTGWLT